MLEHSVKQQFGPISGFVTFYLKTEINFKNALVRSLLAKNAYLRKNHAEGPNVLFCKKANHDFSVLDTTLHIAKLSPNISSGLA